MKAIAGLVMLALASTAAGEDREQRKRAHAEKLAVMASHTSRHFRKQGVGHSDTAPASLMGHARKDERSRKAREPSAKKAEHAEKIRGVADQISEQHRKHMERPMPRHLHNVRAAQHSLADMKTNKGSREPSGSKAHAAKNAEQKESLDKLAKHISQHFSATAVRDAAVKRNPTSSTIRTAHDDDGRASGHGAAPMRETMNDSHLKGMQHRLRQVSPEKLHRNDAKDEISNPAKEGQE